MVALVGTTVFFQRGLQSRTSAFEETHGSLQECNVALENYQEKYFEAESQANETAQDIRKYDQLYEQKIGELQDSNEQVKEIQKQLAFEILQKEQFQTKYEAELTAVQERDLTIGSLNKQIVDLKEDKKDLQEELGICEAG